MKFILSLLFVLGFSTSMAMAKDQACSFEFDVDNSKVEGTGFKYTEKAGVTGVFPGVKLNKTAKASDPKELLKDLVVTVNLMTLDSGNAIRDKNMRETFFSGILGDSVAVVTVKEIKDKKIKAEIMINEKSQTIDFDYTMTKDSITAKGKFDAMKFALGDQIAALKKRCGSLHTGADNKSVTWTEFDLAVVAKIKKTCQ